MHCASLLPRLLSVGGDVKVKSDLNASHNLVPRVSSYRPLRRARRDPGTRWSRAALTIEAIREGSSVIRQFVALSVVEFKVLRCAATDICPRCLTVLSLRDEISNIQIDAKNITMFLENRTAFSK